MYLLSLEILIAALSCRIDALKRALSDEQLAIYEKAMLELKEKFVNNHPEMTETHLKQVSELLKVIYPALS